MKKIDAEKVEAEEVVAKLTEDDLRVINRARTKIDATKSVIETLTNEIAREYEVVRKVWIDYDYPDDIDKKLSERGLTLSIRSRTGEVVITKISEDEMKQALFHNLYW